MNTSNATWYVVVSQGNVALGVYGSALKDMAEEQKKKVEEAGFTAFIKTITGPRPSVGDFV